MLHRRGTGAPGLPQLPWEWKNRSPKMQIDFFFFKENGNLVTVLRTTQRKQSKMTKMFE